MAGPPLLGLQHGLGVRGDLGQIGGDLLGPVADDDDLALRAAAAGWRAARARAGCARAADAAPSAVPTACACLHRRRVRRPYVARSSAAPFTGPTGRRWTCSSGRRLTAHGSQTMRRRVVDAPYSADDRALGARIRRRTDSGPGDPSVILTAMPTRRQALLGAAASITAIAGASVGLIQLTEAGLVPGKSAVDEQLGYCDVTVPPARHPAGVITTGQLRLRPAAPDGRLRDRIPAGCPSRNGVAGVSRLARVRSRRLGRPGRRQLSGLPRRRGGRGHPAICARGRVRRQRLLAPASRTTTRSACCSTSSCHCSRGTDCTSTGRRVLGYSMGGFGALLCGLAAPGRFASIIASSPAFWRSYDEAEHVNPGAFASASDWDRYGDLLSQAAAISRLPAQIYVGAADSFTPAIRTLRDRLADPDVVHVAKGCHDNSYWRSQAPAQLRLVGAALASI